MLIINKIEINYFRSIYGVYTKNLNDLNIIVGGNDVGKSNYLRALNLFFNNETNYAEELDFLQDVTHLREAEAIATKGRLTIWIKLHFENFLGWRTLPDKFYIKKTWNRYADEPEIKSDIENKQTLTRFLNKIQFHYIPAVKDPDIFAYYLVSLYETLAKRQDISFERQALDLSRAIGSATKAMSTRIEAKLGVKSRIKVPTDLEAIFERLEFSTKQNNRDVPLQNRGDGVQARHIPHILDYISRNNGKYNIWGYEEPENSLEMGNCFRLADEFVNSFASKNQIFITSHSPAFYSLKNGKVSKLAAVKIERNVGDISSQTTSFRNLDNAEEMDIELGVATLIAERTKALHLQLEGMSKINRELKTFTLPTLLTEGSTDKDLLELAWSKLYPDREREFLIKSCDVGNNSEEKAGADQLRSVLESTPKDSAILRIGLFDNDTKGRNCFKNIKRHSNIELFDTVKFNDNGCSCAFLLPDVTWVDEYFKFAEKEIPIEMMFPRAAINSRFIDYQFTTQGGNVSRGVADKFIELYKDDLVELKKFMRTKILFKNKRDFVKFAETLPVEDFSQFSEIFDTVRYCIKSLKNFQ